MSKSLPPAGCVDPARRARGDREEDPVGGHRHRPRGRRRPGEQAGRHQPADHPQRAVRAARIAELEEHFAGRGYGDLKKELAEVVTDFVTPVRQRTAGAARRPGRAGAGPRRTAPPAPARSPRATRRRRLRPGRLPRAGGAARVNDDTFVPRQHAPPPETTVLGIVVPIPEPWAQLLVDWRAKVGDPQASLVPPHVTLLPPTEVAVADRPAISRAPGRGGRAATRRSTCTCPARAPSRPVSDVVFVAVARGIGNCELIANDVRRGPLARVAVLPVPPARHRGPRRPRRHARAGLQRPVRPLGGVPGRLPSPSSSRPPAGRGPSPASTRSPVRRADRGGAAERAGAQAPDSGGEFRRRPDAGPAASRGSPGRTRGARTLIAAQRRRYRWFDHLARAGGRYQRMQGDLMAAGVTYFAFLGLFPVLLLVASVVGLVLAGDALLQQELFDAILETFPGSLGRAARRPADRRDRRGRRTSG